MIRFTTSTYGFPADNLGAIWNMWWLRNASALGGSASFCPLVGFPFGSHLGFIPMEPVGYLFNRILLLFINEVPAYNLDIFMSFFVSGITMYFLVRFLTNDRRAAFFGGFLYLIAPYHAYHTMYMGGGISTVQWMPLYILLLIKFIKITNWRSAGLLVLGAVLVAGTSVHYGLFMVIFTAAFLVGRYVYTKVCQRHIRKTTGLERGTSIEVDRRKLVISLTVLLVVIAVLLPFVYGGLLTGSPAAEWQALPGPTTRRDFRSAELGAAWPSDYFVPLLKNVKQRFEAGDTIESDVRPYRYLYLGLTTILLAALGLILALRGDWRKVRGKPKRRGSAPEGDPLESVSSPSKDSQAIVGFAVAAMVAFAFSLKPFLYIGSARIPMPSSIMRLFAPWFRWYVRFGVVVNICLIVLACFGLRWLLRRIKKRYGYFLLLVIVIISAVDLVIVPPFRSFDFKDVPPVFDKVASLSEGSALAFYPLVETGPFITSQLMFYQRFFEKPMLNGASEGSDGEALRRSAFNPFNQATPGVLRRYDIEYLVFFNEQYQSKDGDKRPLPELPAGLELQERSNEQGPFESASLYRITSPKAEIVPIYTGNITVPVLDENGNTTRLVVEEGVIRLLNFSGGDVSADVKLKIENPFPPRKVVVTSNAGDLLFTQDLGEGQSTTIHIENLVIPAEGMDLKLRVIGSLAELSPASVRTFGEQYVSLKIGDVEVSVK